MNCKQIETHLIEYLDGNLSPVERTEIDAHAKSCTLCAERVQGFSNVFGMLDSWKEIEPSPSFNLRLEQRLAAEAASRGWWRNFAARWVPFPIGMPGHAIAMLAMVVVGGIAFKYSSSDSTPVVAINNPQPAYVTTVSASTDDLALYRNLPVLEDLDVLRDFEVLQELDPPNTVAQ